MVDPRQHMDNRGWIESMLRYIPGYRGFLEAEYRRESDHLTRLHILNRLAQAKLAIDAYQEQLVNSGNLEDIGQCERALTSLITLGNRIRGDVEGYSGMFDFVQIGTDQLDRIYEHDLALVADVDAFVKTTETLVGRTETPAQLAQELKQQVDAIAKKYAERTNILQGLATPH